MNYKMMGRFIALTMAVESLFMLPALFISLFKGETNSAKGFLISIAIMLL